MTVPASTNRHLSSDAVPQAGAGKNSDSALPSLRFSSTNWLSLSLPETSLSTTVRKTGEGNHIWMDFCHRSWCLTSELTSHSKEIISQWHCTPRVYSFPLTFIHHDWKSCTVFPASPLFLCEEHGCLDFMGPEGKHTLISPWTHKCIPMSIPPPICLLQAHTSSSAACWEMSLWPHNFYDIRSPLEKAFTLLWRSLRDVQKASSLSLPLGISATVAEMRTRVSYEQEKGRRPQQTLTTAKSNWK